MPTMKVLPLVLSKQTFTAPTARLVAIAFFACSTLFLTVAAGAWAFNDRPDVPRYAEVVDLYRMLAILATVFLVVPAISLGVASAKLSARRQDERLSTLSLLGASKGTVRLVAVAEPFIPAAAGIVAGILGYLVLAYPLSLIVFTGVPLGYSALLMPAWLLVGVVAVLLLICLLAALIGLRKVIVSPLGVRTRSLGRTFPLARIITVVVLAVGMVAALVFSLQEGQSQRTAIIASILTIGVALLLINVVGVLVMRIHAWMSGKAARRPAGMLSAAMIADAPAQYWRRVAGLALITFIAVVGGTGAAMMRGTGDEMSAAERDVMGPLQYTGDDVFTGLILTLAIAFVLIVVSATINQAADILDRASTYRELHAAGMSPAMMHRVTVRAVMSPIVLVTLVSLVLGGLLAAAMASAGDLGDPLTIAVVASVLLGGIAMVWLGLQFTRPLVRRVTAVTA